MNNKVSQKEFQLINNCRDIRAMKDEAVHNDIIQVEISEYKRRERGELTFEEEIGVDAYGFLSFADREAGLSSGRIALYYEYELEHNHGDIQLVERFKPEWLHETTEEFWNDRMGWDLPSYELDNEFYQPIHIRAQVGGIS